MIATFRHAIRSLRRAPAFTAGAVLTLAAGTGLATALLAVARAGRAWTPPPGAPGMSRAVAGEARTGWTAALRTAGEMQHEGLSRFLDVLSGATLLVLAAACVNVAALLLSRASARRHETAMRAVLGAPPRRIAAQAAAEAAVVAGLGAVLGWLAGLAGLRLLRATWPGEAPWMAAGPDATVALTAAGVPVAVALLFALLPVLRAGRVNLHAALTVGGRATAGRGEGVARRTVAVAQLAASTMLLAGAALLVRGAAPGAETASPGFDPRDTLTLRVDLPAALAAGPARRAAALEGAAARVRALPGVRAAAVSTPEAWLALGPEDRVHTLCYDCVGANMRLHMPVSAARHAAVGPGYFRAMGVPLLEGREITAADRVGAARVAVVSESFVHRLFPTPFPRARSSVLGRKVLPNGINTPAYTIVGIVGDMRPAGLGTPSDPVPVLYLSALQHPPESAALAVRAAGDPAALAPAVARAVGAALPGARTHDAQAMEARLAAYAAPARWLAGALAAVAAVAALLCAAGVYGVVAFGVARRTREIGVRMALGARAGQVVRLVLGQGLRLARTGTAVGVLAAVALGRTMQTLFRGVDLGHLPTYAGVAAALAAIALLASYLPARRAARVDPVVSLRAE